MKKKLLIRVNEQNSRTGSQRKIDDFQNLISWIELDRQKTYSNESPTLERQETDSVTPTPDGKDAIRVRSKSMTFFCDYSGQLTRSLKKIQDRKECNVIFRSD